MESRRRLAAPRTMRALATVALGALTLAGGRAAAQAPEKEGPPKTEVTVGYSYKNDVTPPLRDMPAIPFRLQPEREMLEPKGFPVKDFSAPDPVVQRSLAPAAMPGTILNFDGIGFPGVACNCSPPDTNGEVGATQYVQTVNIGVQVFNKTTGASLLGPVDIATLWQGFGGLCETQGQGDPVVLYDQLANRWVVTQFAGPIPITDECIAVSQTSDATGAWYRYGFHLGSNFYDYPKLGVWPDAYYMSMNVFNSAGTAFLGPQPFAFNRAAMLTGAAATFVTPGLQPTTLGSLIPADLDGSNPPPAGAPNPWLSAEQLAQWQVYRFHVDFVTPANTTWTLGGNLAPAGYTILSASVPQSGTGNTLDNLADRPMFRLAYRRFADNHEALIGNLTVASGGVAGVRWWEINNATSGTPAFVQQGTYQPDSTWRWMGSIAMDFVGNMALGFSASSSSIFPGIRYAGRLSTDPAGQLSQGEATLIAGGGSQTSSNRWGDYSDMTVDPVDDCTFWYTTEYYSASAGVNWKTRIGNFKFPSCSLAPTFTLAVTPASQNVCAGSSAAYTVNVGSVSGFNSPVTLGATGNPAPTTVGFVPNPVTPLPGSSTLTVGNTGTVAAGPYTINVTGSAAGPINLNQNVTLNVFTATPGTPTPTAPANAATGVALTPTFTWSAASQASSYTLEIATDAAFTTIVHTSPALSTTTYNGATLNSNTAYYWRVRAVNACNTGSNSAAFTFTTLALPGDCPIGTAVNILYQYGFESGASGWTHSAATGTDTWAIVTTNPHSGTSNYRGLDPATTSDQRLVSPSVALPTGQNPVVLSFWHVPNMEPSGTTACFDGGLLEVSSNGGTTWTQVPPANLLLGGYRGAISSSFSNPLAGLQAWCGTTTYTNTIADLTSYAGQTVQLRYRLGSDSSVSNPGWDIDDVKVQSCPPVPVELQSLSIE